jgi:hypothetical protein
LSIHFKLTQYQAVIGTITANQLQSSIRNTATIHSHLARSNDQGTQYIENKKQDKIIRNAPFLVEILENARKTQRGTFSFFSIVIFLALKID